MSNIVPLRPVKSSNISQEGYDPATQTLAIQFSSGSTYHYSHFPPADYAAFQASESKGAHFARHIRNNFKGERVVAEDADRPRAA